MGNCNLKREESEEWDNHLVNYRLLLVIGKGGFGKVWKVEWRKNKQIVALKMMPKAKIISKKSVHSVMNELQLLSSLRHEFLINVVGAFQDRANLYLVMDYVAGGDLRYHICKNKRFSEQQTSNQFFVGCILVGLEYLHSNSVIHRDIKPENLVFDGQGYLRITDLGISRVWRPSNATDTSGTPGYMSPEVICRQNHGIAADYFALGVIVYECMLGRRPYVGKNRQEIRELMLARQVQIKPDEVPQGWSKQAVDFANKLLLRKPTARLGTNGPTEVLSHDWLADLNFDRLRARDLKAPFIPNDQEQNYVKTYNHDSQADLNDQNKLLLRRNSIQQLFDGYLYNPAMQGSTHQSSR